ncbi:PRTRC system protein E [Mucilaginibacter sp. SJ]|uniref:PRTRC system protein E n=1 Tax=Mucilaginibacter sp. SJ TaxID=3029053 RepID=UPI0023A91CD6|nr:PRTRC system protein E [Mucilaginibacter sp. SJ]WEA01766.1 PRTRC system protein E [Mucilaginibacter sp. SJ]
MTTNFFEQISALAFQGALNLNMIKNTDGLLTVSVYLPNATTDAAGTVIPPMILKGKATELDEGFFGAITVPVQQTASLFANMEAYQQSLKKAAELSKAEQDKKNKGKAKTTAAATPADDDDDDDTPDTENLFSAQENEQKAIAEKKKRYAEAIAQISELNKQCKYEDALALLPTAEEYPEHAEEIERKGAELRKRKAQYDELMKDI